MSRRLTTIMLTIAIAFGVMAPATAQTREPRPTPAPQYEQGTRLRGEGEWTFATGSGTEVLLVTRFDSEGDADHAELVVSFMADPDLIEDATDMRHVDTFRVPRQYGYCEGVELDNRGQRLYAAICADGEYVNFVLGTDGRVVLEVIGQVQDGYEPTAPRGYREVTG